VRVSVYVATSLDGFIARKNGDLDWLTQADSAGHDDYGYAEFMASVTCIVMGRKTLETVLQFPHWPYPQKRVVVLSNTLTELPQVIDGQLEVTNEEINELTRRLKAAREKRLYIDGGQTIQGFLQQGLITDLTITYIPVLLGEGIALFGHLPADIQLKHLKTRTYANGFVQSHYSCLYQ